MRGRIACLVGMRRSIDRRNSKKWDGERESWKTTGQTRDIIEGLGSFFLRPGSGGGGWRRKETRRLVSGEV